MRKCRFFLILFFVLASVFCFSKVITFSFVGDVMFHTPILSYAKNGDSYDFKPIFAHVKGIIEKADVAFCNLETTLGGTPYAGYPRFSSPDEVVDALIYAGFDVVNVANNHMIDKGWKGLKHTIEKVRESGLASVGGRLSTSEKKYTLINVDGVSVAFASFTYATNGLTVPKEYAYMFDYIDEGLIAQTVKEMRKVSDIVIVHLHFGQEHMTKPSDVQRKIATLCIDNGADMVIGTHPHVLQNIEFVERDGKQKMIAYSLGNFLSNMDQKNTDAGVILNVTYDTTKGVVDINPIPTWRHRYTKDGKLSFRVIPVETFLKNPDKLLTKEDIARLKEIEAQTKMFFPVISERM
ncbi:MAG TPA: CapA family protein [Fervidobacterium sp.]|nr:CapA family protein [Fervidobacterium sp.]HPT54949.1 CapA family protein [Fervidobacterium sp.]HPZ18537.1 CapA family protein [Fervidobacterium sp.]HQE50083.1 CapA family protein [Fervidobacterium sp.]HUM44069.1 CapA family protein [Fervidobacterium sp.]